MSNFSYGKHTPKHLGIWIRYQSNPDIIALVKADRNLRFSDTVSRVVVNDYDEETDEVWLEIWTSNFIDFIRGKHRYSVFYIKTKVNEDWICEGDLGAGINFYD